MVNGNLRIQLMEVPTIYKAYFLGLNFRGYPHNSYGQKYGTNVPPDPSSNKNWPWRIHHLQYIQPAHYQKVTRGLSRIRCVNFGVLTIHDVPGRVENLQEFIH